MNRIDLFLILLPLYIIAINVSKKNSFTWHLSFWGLSLSFLVITLNGTLELLKDLG